MAIGATQVKSAIGADLTSERIIKQNECVFLMGDFSLMVGLRMESN